MKQAIQELIGSENDSVFSFVGLLLTPQYAGKGQALDDIARSAGRV